MVPSLDDILAHKKIEVEALKAKLLHTGSTTVMRALASTHSLADAVRDPAFAVIPELKKADPWRGVFMGDYAIGALATSLVEAGAPAIAVQTDTRFFQGSYDDLYRASRHIDVAILQRDFVVDEAQLTQAKAYGADAAVLMARLLSDDDLRRFIEFGALIMLEVTIEVRTAEELDRALAANAPVIGIQNRDLRTQETYFDELLALGARVPKDTPVYAVGGLDDAGALATLRDAGFGGAIVGEAVMGADDPVATYRALTPAPPAASS